MKNTFRVFALFFGSLFLPTSFAEQLAVYPSSPHDIEMPEFCVSKIGVSIEEGSDKIIIHAYKKGDRINVARIDIKNLYEKYRHKKTDEGSPLFGDTVNFILEDQSENRNYLVFLDAKNRRFQLFKLQKFGDFYLEQEKGVEGDDEALIRWLEKIKLLPVQ